MYDGHSTSLQSGTSKPSGSPEVVAYSRAYFLSLVNMSENTSISTPLLFQQYRKLKTRRTLTPIHAKSPLFYIASPDAETYLTYVKESMNLMAVNLQ